MGITTNFVNLKDSKTLFDFVFQTSYIGQAKVWSLPVALHGSFSSASIVAETGLLLMNQ